MANNGLPNNYISRIVGYTLNKGFFQSTSPNLPQSVAILAEANDANQSTLNLNPQLITSAQQAGQLYGFGSPTHMIARILFPQGGNGLSSIPVTVFPQSKAIGATPTIVEVSVSGIATGNGTHYLNIAGRENVDGSFYEIDINTGDTVSTISQKIYNAVNNVLGSPVAASDNEYSVALQTKWSGATSSGLNVSVDTGSNTLGLTYTVTTTQIGTGIPSIQSALNLFGNAWYTTVINSYGTDTNTMSLLEQFNGIPDPNNPTGRYAGIIMKPFIALTGSVLDNPSGITSTHSNNVTIALCVAPNSPAFEFEAAANVCALFSTRCQNNPELDIAGMSYPDMPTPQSLGTMSLYVNRNQILQQGCSTVDMVNGQYVVEDFVTTYAPIGEIPPQYQYCRNLNLDWNVRYSYYLLEQANVVGAVIANDSDVVSVQYFIKPKMWKSILNNMFQDLTNRGLIVDSDFSNQSLSVNIDSLNPNRLDTLFSYKRSGTVRVASTTATAGFNFGSLN